MRKSRIVMMTREEEEEKDHQNNNYDEQTRVLYELSSMIIHILGSPPVPPLPLPVLNFLSVSAPPTSSSLQASLYSSPSDYAALLLGMSMAMVRFGSITLFIDLVLLPWIVGLVCLFYIADIAYSLSVLGHSFLCSATATATAMSCFKDLSEWEL